VRISQKGYPKNPLVGLFLETQVRHVFPGLLGIMPNRSKPFLSLANPIRKINAPNFQRKANGPTLELPRKVSPRINQGLFGRTEELLG